MPRISMYGNVDVNKMRQAISEANTQRFIANCKTCKACKEHGVGTPKMLEALGIKRAGLVAWLLGHAQMHKDKGIPLAPSMLASMAPSIDAMVGLQKLEDVKLGKYPKERKPIALMTGDRLRDDKGRLAVAKLSYEKMMVLMSVSEFQKISGELLISKKA